MSGIWAACRKHDADLKRMMVARKKAFERKQEKSRKQNGDPAKKLTVVGRRVPLAKDDAAYYQVESREALVPWNGKYDNMIDRFDARSLIDRIRCPRTRRAPHSTGDPEQDNVLAFHRWHALVEAHAFKDESSVIQSVEDKVTSTDINVPTQEARVGNGGVLSLPQQASSSPTSSPSPSSSTADGTSSASANGSHARGAAIGHTYESGDVLTAAQADALVSKPTSATANTSATSSPQQQQPPRDHDNVAASPTSTRLSVDTSGKPLWMMKKQPIVDTNDSEPVESKEVTLERIAVEVFGIRHFNRIKEHMTAVEAERVAKREAEESTRTMWRSDIKSAKAPKTTNGGTIAQDVHRLNRRSGRDSPTYDDYTEDIHRLNRGSGRDSPTYGGDDDDDVESAAARATRSMQVKHASEARLDRLLREEEERQAAAKKETPSQRLQRMMEQQLTMTMKEDQEVERQKQLQREQADAERTAELEAQMGGRRDISLSIPVSSSSDRRRRRRSSRSPSPSRRRRSHSRDRRRRRSRSRSRSRSRDRDRRRRRRSRSHSRDRDRRRSRDRRRRSRSRDRRRRSGSRDDGSSRRRGRRRSHRDSRSRSRSRSRDRDRHRSRRRRSRSGSRNRRRHRSRSRSTSPQQLKRQRSRDDNGTSSSMTATKATAPVVTAAKPLTAADKYSLLMSQLSALESKHAGKV